MAVTDDHCPVLVIPLIGIRPQELGHLRFHRLRDELPGTCPHHCPQRIADSSIFLLRFSTLPHRGVSPLWLKVGVVRTAISNRDTASFQLTANTNFEYSSESDGLTMNMSRDGLRNNRIGQLVVMSIDLIKQFRETVALFSLS
jgi:hypothetical protein